MNDIKQAKFPMILMIMTYDSSAMFRGFPILHILVLSCYLNDYFKLYFWFEIMLFS